MPLKTRKVFLVLAHDRRRILYFNVIRHPTAEWTGQQLREAFPLTNPHVTCCGIFGQDFRLQVRDIGTEEVLLLQRENVVLTATRFCHPFLNLSHGG